MEQAGEQCTPSAISELLLDVASQLNTLDLDSLSGPALHHEFVGCLRGVDALHASIARLAKRWLDSGEWAMDGSKSAATRLSRETGQSKSSCSRRLATSRALPEMPAVAQAWADGRISEDLVNSLEKVRRGRDHYFQRDQVHLLELCADLRYADAQRAIRYWADKVDQEDNPDGTQPVQEFFRLEETFDGAVSLTGLLDPISGATVQEAVRQIEHELYLDDRRSGATRTPAERRAAALVEMAIRATTAPADGKRPEPLITIIAGEAAFDRVLELSNGAIITAGAIVPHLSRAQVQSFVFNGMTPIAATDRRTFTGRLRRAIQARDRRCQHPSGCDEPLKHCDVDHIDPHGHGGQTSADNGRLLCAVHNRNETVRDRAPSEDTTHLVGADQVVRKVNDRVAEARQRTEDESLARARLAALRPTG